MRRRAFLLGLAGAVAASGRGSVAPMMERMGRVGVLVPGSAQTAAASPRLRTFYATLAELGWIEGRNIAFEPRYAEGQLPRLAELAEELARLGPDVIVTASTLPAKAAQAATRRIPIVMMDPGDPVATGLVTSLAHPTANLTGISSVAPDLAGKRLETLKQAVPSVTKVAIFYNAAIPPAEVAMQEMEAAAALLTIQIASVPVGDAHGFEAAFATVRREGADGMIVFADPLTFNNQAAIVAFAAKAGIPVLFAAKEFVDAGGLISYGPNYPDMFRRGAYFVDRILKGAKPSDLPVEQPTKFELVINLRTARALGLTMPPTLLARADEVIE